MTWPSCTRLQHRQGVCQDTSRLTRQIHESIIHYQEYDTIPDMKLKTIDDNIRDFHQSSPLKNHKRDSEIEMYNRTRYVSLTLVLNLKIHLS